MRIEEFEPGVTECWRAVRYGVGAERVTVTYDPDCSQGYHKDIYPHFEHYRYIVRACDTDTCSASRTLTRFVSSHPSGFHTTRLSALQAERDDWHSRRLKADREARRCYNKVCEYDELIAAEVDNA